MYLNVIYITFFILQTHYLFLIDFYLNFDYSLTAIPVSFNQFIYNLTEITCIQTCYSWCVSFTIASFWRTSYSFHLTIYVILFTNSSFNLSNLVYMIPS